MTDVIYPEETALQSCKKCTLPISEGHAYELGDDRWHISCFKCSKCESSLGCNSNFLVLGNGNLICLNCSYNCKQCGKKIDDLAILTGDQAYCSSCFKCRSCKLKIEDLRYARTSKGLFCMSCHEKLIAKKKKYDAKKRQLALLNQRDSDPENRHLHDILNVRNASPSLSDLNRLLSTVRDKILPAAPDRNSIQSTKTDSSIPSVESAVERGSDDHILRKDLKEAKRESSRSIPRVSSPRIETAQAESAAEKTEKRRLDKKEAILTPNDEPSGYFDARNDFPEKKNGLSRKPPPSNDSETTSNSTNHVQPSTASTSDYLIEEINDSDDELNIKKHRPLQLLEDGIILDLIDSISAPTTPLANTDGLEPALDVTPKQVPSEKQEIRAKAEETLLDGNADSTIEQEVPERAPRGKNLLIFLPNQYHDHEFHAATNQLSPNPNEKTTLAPEERTRSAATLPFARANRQARVVETNDDIPTDSIGDDNFDYDAYTAYHRATTPQRRQAMQQITPVPASPSLPAPRVAPPAVPQTPVKGASIERGLGLEGIDYEKRRSAGMAGAPARTPTQLHFTPARTPTQLHVSQLQPAQTQNGRIHALNSPTPAVTNLEEADPQSTLSRKSTLIRTPKISLKHKRSTSGGTGKFGFFKSRDESPNKGHARHVSDGSIANAAAAYTTPPLPLTLPLGYTSQFAHTRTFSDTPFLTSLDPQNQPATTQKPVHGTQAVKAEIAQLENYRNTLDSDVTRLGKERNALNEVLLALQKQIEAEKAALANLTRDVTGLQAKKTKLLDINQSLSESNHQLELALKTPSVHRLASQDESNLGSISSSSLVQAEADDGIVETQKATRLKFWRRPKVGLGSVPQIVTTSIGGSATAISNASTGSNGTSHSNGGGNGTNGVQNTPKLSQSYSSNAIQIPRANPNAATAEDKKGLGSFIAKSRSSNILDSFLSKDEVPEVPLLTSSLQQRADFEQTPVPLIITKCIEEVERRGLDAEGIYRISGGQLAILAIEGAFAAIRGANDEKLLARVEEALSGDINAVTLALKRYLRKLPDPVVPFSLYDEFIKVGSSRDKLAALHAVVQRLPAANLHALRLLCRHLARVSAHQAQNRMNVRNLLVVFAPTLARDETGEREMADMGARNDATEFLLGNTDAIFA